MKNTRTLWRVHGVLAIIVLIGFTATACRFPTGQQQQPQPYATRVVIPLPEIPDARSIGLDTARAYTNYFEVFFRRTDSTPATFYSASATLAEGSIETEVPAGTYDILLFAGHRRGNNFSPLLLASSYVLNRGIVWGEVNQIHMVLETLDVNITAPDNVVPAEDFTVTVEVDTKNPLIAELPASGSGIPLNLSYQSGNVTLPFVSSSNNLWQYSGTLTAPAMDVEGNMWLDGLALTPFSQGSFGSWYWTLPSSWGNALNALLIGRDIVISAPVIGTPDVEIIITWPEGGDGNSPHLGLPMNLSDWVYTEEWTSDGSIFTRFPTGESWALSNPGLELSGTIVNGRLNLIVGRPSASYLENIVNRFDWEDITISDPNTMVFLATWLYAGNNIEFDRFHQSISQEQDGEFGVSYRVFHVFADRDVTLSGGRSEQGTAVLEPFTLIFMEGWNVVHQREVWVVETETTYSASIAMGDLGYPVRWVGSGSLW